jgi:hypothetical protein
VNSSLKKVALVGALGAVVLAVGYFVFRGDDDQLTVNQPLESDQRPSPNVEADPEYLMVGGVRRKASDLRRVERAKRTHPHHPSSGITSTVALDANEDVASLVEAFREKKYPERVSPLVEPKKFDLAEFEKDPNVYLHVIEPGRVFQTAQPGPGVSVLRPAGPRIHRVLEGGSVKFRVQAVPGAPVAFSSFDLGQFSNQLTSITVRADKQGVAEVDFLAAPGPYVDMHVLAGSPVTTGQVRFIINVLSPDVVEAPKTGG